MFCPKCGSSQPDDLNYCKTCGAHLQGVRTALEGRAPEPGDLDWNKTWVAELAMTRDEKDRRRGMTAEMKRIREIKAGVITASVGVGLTLVLAAIMDGIIIGGRVSPAAIAILSRLWIVGLIPILVGLALVVNGMFISKRGEAGRQDETGPSLEQPDQPSDQFLPPADTNELVAANFSVVEDTTKHLKTPRRS